MTYTVTEEQLQHFREKGFVHLPGANTVRVFAYE